MAGGKLSPRQQMINMMYLVLTAMLALNVSAEVLDAFVTIDKGINQSTDIIREKNLANLDDFEKAMEENREKVEPWKNKADSVHAKTAEFYDYLHQLKVRIIRSGDGKDSKAVADSTAIDVGAINAKDNTDAASRIMLGSMRSGEAFTLKERINEYKHFLLNFIDENSPAAHSIERMLLTENPPMTADGTNRTWESQFESLPLVSAVAILSKKQLDIASCESEVLTYLRNQVDASDFKFSSIDVITAPETKYVLKGTEFKAEIYLAAYDPTQRPTLNIGGRTYSANEKGKIEYKAMAETVGPKNYTGMVEFIGPEGLTQRPVTINFEVAEPNVVISPTKMNVVYRGLDNPLGISLSGVSHERLEARVSNDNGTISRSGSEFLVRPGSGRACDVSVFLDGKNMGTMSFRVKDVPRPSPAIFGISGRTASRGELQAAEGVVAEMKDFDFDLKYNVTEFTVAVVTSDGYTREETSKTARFNEKQKQLFNGVRAGQRIWITDVKAVGPDGKAIDLNDFSIRVR